MIGAKKNVQMDVEAPSLVPLLEDQVLSNAEYRVSLAVGHAARTRPRPVSSLEPAAATAEAPLVIPISSLEHALRVAAEAESDLDGKGPVNTASLNEYERKIMGDVVPASELNVLFSQIGALEKEKANFSLLFFFISNLLYRQLFASLYCCLSIVQNCFAKEI